MIKVGAITIGQSPREDVTKDILPILGENIELLQAGGLDGLTLEEIEKFAPEEGDYVLVSTLRDGTSVKFAEKHILKRLQNCIYELENKGVEIIVFLCTGEFPAVFESKVPVLFPSKVLNSLVPILAHRSKIAVLTPDTTQIKQTENKWKNYVSEITAVAGSPYKDIQEVKDAAVKIKELDVDLVVMDCIGYSEEMKSIIRKESGKNVVLSRTIVARIIKELVG